MWSCDLHVIDTGLVLELINQVAQRLFCTWRTNEKTYIMKKREREALTGNYTGRA